MNVDTDRRRFIASVVGGAVAAMTGTVTAQQEGDGTTHEIDMTSSNVFDPIGLYIQPGDTVRWTSQGGVHNAVSYEGRIPEQAEAFNYDLIEEGESIEHTFDTEGTYDYYCNPHRTLGMVGRIVVGEPGGPGEQGEVPDPPEEGEVPTGEEITEGESLPYPFTGLEEGTGGLPFGVAQAAPATVGGLIAASVGYYFSEENKGEDGNNALAVGLATLIVGILLILAVVIRLTS